MYLKVQINKGYLEPYRINTRQKTRIFFPTEKLESRHITFTESAMFISFLCELSTFIKSFKVILHIWSELDSEHMSYRSFKYIGIINDASLCID